MNYCKKKNNKKLTIASFLTTVRKLIFSHTSGWTEFKMYRNVFEDDESLGLFQLSQKMFKAKISCRFVENGKPFMDSEVKCTNIGTVRQTRLHSVDTQVSASDKIGMGKEGLSLLTRSLHNDLEIEILDCRTKNVIANCTVIFDLKPLLVKIYQKESAMVRLEETETFLNAVRDITGSFATIYKGNLINHYRMFVANL